MEPEHVVGLFLFFLFPPGEEEFACLCGIVNVLQVLGESLRLSLSLVCKGRASSP